eukprot:946345-Prymnesium_polylepis.2
MLAGTNAAAVAAAALLWFAPHPTVFAPRWDDVVAARQAVHSSGLLLAATPWSAGAPPAQRPAEQPSAAGGEKTGDPSRVENVVLATPQVSAPE